MNASVLVSTPARLHFGLIRFEQSDGLSYGGLGMMVDTPRTDIEVSLADEWSVGGKEGAKALAAAQQALLALRSESNVHAARICVLAAPESHQGLGSGTQRALAVAAAMRRLCGLHPAAPHELARMVGRGTRSAIGSHGFVYGGLLWERGRRAHELLTPLSDRCEVPSAWRIVLVTSPTERGLSGRTEGEAFKRLPPIPEKATRRLEELAEGQILPAARAGDIDQFGEGVYSFGRLSGEAFSAVQGGPYASPLLEARVAAIRDTGVMGVGQSSWGPTLFACVVDTLSAERLAAELRPTSLFDNCEFRIVAPDNRGAIVRAATSPHA